MNLAEKIRILRESKQWSQEEVVQKMNMSKPAYARIENGITRPKIDRIIKLAEVFEINILDLIDEKRPVVIFNTESQNGSNYYGDSALEIEKLKGEIKALQTELQSAQDRIAEKDKHIAAIQEAKNNEIHALKDMIALLKQK